MMMAPVVRVPVVVPPVMMAPAREVADAARAVIGPDHAAAPVVAVVRIIIVRIERGAIEGPPMEVMTVRDREAAMAERSAPEHRPAAKGAAVKDRAASPESTALERRAASSKSTAVERRATAVKRSSAMEGPAASMETSASAMETSAASVEAPAAATVTAATAATAATNLARQTARGGFRERRRGRIKQRHRLGALTRCGRQRQHRGHHKARAHQTTAAPGIQNVDHL